MHGLYSNFEERISKKLYGQDCLFDDIENECSLHRGERKGKNLRKTEKQILQKKHSVLQKHAKIGLAKQFKQMF